MRSPTIAVVLVHYYTPDLVVRAVAALQRDLSGPVEWVVVDNGNDERGRRILAELPVRIIDPGGNLGYAGGVNAGMAATRAEVALVMNPDVEVVPGCVAALSAQLKGRQVGVAGPRFYWDESCRFLLPPGEIRSRRAEWTAARGGERARRAWRRHARRHWEAGEAISSHALSGSLLAIRRDAWDDVGPFDEGFRLYFEETDWLLRARQRGWDARFVPTARAVHFYNQSAGREAEARNWFEESARRFRRKHYGRWFAWSLESFARTTTAASAQKVEECGLDLTPFHFPLWVELSPRREGFPAAGEWLASPVSRWQIPGEVHRRWQGGPLFARLVEPNGRELGCWQAA
jgi:N-acetylglucosaminyl-diphospho-decaprenol L-rhamnosyltransferase